jgi:hypothetical protein
MTHDALCDLTTLRACGRENFSALRWATTHAPMRLRAYAHHDAAGPSIGSGGFALGAGPSQTDAGHTHSLRFQAGRRMPRGRPGPGEASAVALPKPHRGT